MKSPLTGPSPTVIASVMRRLVNDGYSIENATQPIPSKHQPGFVTFSKKGYAVQGVVKVLDTVRRYDERMIRAIMSAERELDSACRKPREMEPPDSGQ